MKKFLIFLSMCASLIAMDSTQNQYTRGISIPGALIPSSEVHTHSPTKTYAIDQGQMLQSLRQVDIVATRIKNAATKRLLELFSEGKLPGSEEVSQQLTDEYNQVQLEIVRLKKDMESNQRNGTEQYDLQHKAQRIGLYTNACVLHYAATVNEGLAYNKVGKSEL